MVRFLICCRSPFFEIEIMFKFDFSTKTKESEDDENRYTVCKSDIIWDKSREIVLSEDSELIMELLENTPVNTVTVYDLGVKYISSHHVVQALQNGQISADITILTAEQNYSDLLPAVYEGGLKIWECTYDLLNYIHSNKLNLEDKKVLDLGCGAGLVGILSLIKGSNCCFQDYNSDVIQYITVPNVLLNAKERFNCCRFYSGDWQSFSELLEANIKEEEKFDFIFTSETIYNVENYSKLHYVFEKLLKRNGIIFLAAKSFYFGVGGSILLFQELLDQHKVFKYTSCWQHKEGIRREIIKMKFNLQLL